MLYQAPLDDNNKTRKASDDTADDALAAHKKALLNYQDAASPIRSGYFFVRAPSSPSGPEARKMAAIATDSAPACFDQAAFQERLALTGQVRPAVAASFSPGGGVASVKTPESGTILYLMMKLGSIRIFSSDVDPDAAISPERTIDNHSASAAVVSPPRDGRKEMSFHITEAHLAAIEAADAENKLNGIKTHRSQNPILSRPGHAEKKASMTNLAEAYGIAEEGELFEWLHLICYQIMRELGQKKENLVGGTKHANTLMIPVEAYLPKLAKYFTGNVSVHTSASLHPDTHVAKTIYFNIEIQRPDGLAPVIIPFEFDAMLTHAPSRRVKLIIDTFMEQLISDSSHEIDEMSQLLKDLPGSDLAYLATYLANQKLQEQNQVQDQELDSSATVGPTVLNFDDMDVDEEEDANASSGTSSESDEDYDPVEDDVDDIDEEAANPEVAKMPLPFFSPPRTRSCSPVARHTRSHTPGTIA